MTQRIFYPWDYQGRQCRLLKKHHSEWTIEYQDGTRERVERNGVTVSREQCESIGFRFLGRQTQPANTAE